MIEPTPAIATADDVRVKLPRDAAGADQPGVARGLGEELALVVSPHLTGEVIDDAPLERDSIQGPSESEQP